jgi:hypothetical protein
MSALLHDIDNLRLAPRAMRAIEDAAARRAALASDAYDELLAEFFAAVEAGDASAEIRTPDYGYDSTLGSVLCDDLFGDDERASEFARFLRDAKRGEDVQLRAAEMVARIATSHAAYHRHAVGDDL